MQAAGFQRAALTVTGVPDGVPTQPPGTAPFCTGRNGAVGEIASLGQELQFEGNGRYTVSVSVLAGDRGLPDGGGDRDRLLRRRRVAHADRDRGARPAPHLHRAAALPRSRTEPRGGSAGRSVHASVRRCSPRTVGRPSNLARGRRSPRPGEGGRAGRARSPRDRTSTTARWTSSAPGRAPVPVTVLRGLFTRKRGGRWSAHAQRARSGSRSRRSSAAGGGRRAPRTLTVQRVDRLHRQRASTRGPKVAIVARESSRAPAWTLKVNAPSQGLPSAGLAFGGTRLIRAGKDPVPILLAATSKRFGSGTSARFPRCWGLYNGRAHIPRGRQASTWSVRGVGCESRYRRPRKTPATTKCEFSHGRGLEPRLPVRRLAETR